MNRAVACVVVSRISAYLWVRNSAFDPLRTYTECKGARPRKYAILHAPLKAQGLRLDLEVSG
jgi:hypothetical protein